MYHLPNRTTFRFIARFWHIDRFREDYSLRWHDLAADDTRIDRAMREWWLWIFDKVREMRCDERRKKLFKLVLYNKKKRRHHMVDRQYGQNICKSYPLLHIFFSSLSLFIRILFFLFSTILIWLMDLFRRRITQRWSRSDFSLFFPHSIAC